MTVSEALDFFKGLRDVQTGLAPLGDVGLEYVRLGQPVPTLSGGEAQRLKLAGHLAEAARSGISTAKVAKKGSLFLFDEPTTGLHFDDVARLMRAFRKLLAAGHTLLVIEHNLDVIRAADWLIDLGPEGGDAGGLVIGAGTPQDLMDNPRSHTGAALRDYETSILPTPVADVVVSSDIDAQEAEQAGLTARIAEPDAPYGAGDGTPLQSLMRARRQSAMSIEIRNAREHNLKNVNVEIPRDKFTVITGVSGSASPPGLRHPLQRRPAPLPGIAQRLRPRHRAAGRQARRGRHLRDPAHGRHRAAHQPWRTQVHRGHDDRDPSLPAPALRQAGHAVLPRLQRRRRAAEHRPDRGRLLRERRASTSASWPRWSPRARATTPTWPVGRRARPLAPARGRPVHPRGPWPRLDRYKEHTIELPVADVVVDPANEAELRAAVKSALENGQGVMSVVWPVNKLHEALDSDLQQQHFSVKRACPSCGISFPEPDPRLFSYNSKHGWCTGCFGTGLQLQGFDESRPARKPPGTPGTKARPRSARSATASA